MGNIQSTGNLGSVPAAYAGALGDKYAAQGQVGTARAMAAGAKDVAGIQARSAQALGVMSQDTEMERIGSARQTAQYQADTDLASEREHELAMQKLTELQGKNAREMQEGQQRFQQSILDQTLPTALARTKAQDELALRKYNNDLAASLAATITADQRYDFLGEELKKLRALTNGDAAQTDSFKKQISAATNSKKIAYEILPKGETETQREAYLIANLKQGDPLYQAGEDYFDILSLGGDPPDPSVGHMTPRQIAVHAQLSGNIAADLGTKVQAEVGKPLTGHIPLDARWGLPSKAQDYLRAAGITTYEELRDAVDAQEDLKVDLPGDAPPRSPFYTNPLANAVPFLFRGPEVSSPQSVTYTSKDARRALSGLIAIHEAEGKQLPFAALRNQYANRENLIIGKAIEYEELQRQGVKLSAGQKAVVGAAKLLGGINEGSTGEVIKKGLDNVDATMPGASLEDKKAALYRYLFDQIKGARGAATGIPVVPGSSPSAQLPEGPATGPSY